MASYRVSFFKHLVSSSGKQVRACQRVIVVRSARCDCAVRAAKRQFARIEGVDDWTLRADDIGIEATPDKPASAAASR